MGTVANPVGRETLCLKLNEIIIFKEGGWLLVSNFGHFFMIFGYFMIFFLVSFKKNEIITGLSVFLSVKNDIFAVYQSYQRQTMRMRR